MRKDFKYFINQGLPGGANELKKFVKGSISVTGYKSDSPDVNNDFNIIPSNRITMQGVNFPVLGVDDLGYEQMMMPGGEYNFPGNYVTEIPQMGKGGLTQWFAEKWTDVKTGKPCGRSGEEKGSRPYPACRPSKRVNETTPKTASELSSAEKAKFKREKTSGKRISYNHKRREYGGEAGWLDQYQPGGEFDPEFMFKNKYNTELTSSEEADFSKWAAKESQKQGRDILNDIGAYDVKGFWKSGDYKNMDSDNHGTDTWKKPNHPTFSNQSRYHGADGWYGGNWTDKAGYQPSKQTLETYGPDYYDWMFKSEPGRSEYLDMSRYESGLNKPTPFVYQKGGWLNKYQFAGETSTEENLDKIASIDIKSKMPRVDWYESIDPRNWNLRDYSAVDDYGTAFNRARQAGQNKFYWKGERFNTAQEGEDRSQALFSLSQEERNKIFNSVNPEGYPGSELFPAIKRYINKSSFKDEEPDEFRGVVDDDAWAFFMGVPQEQNSITKSSYKPSNSKNKVKNYYTIRNAYPDFEKLVLEDANKMFTRKGREDAFTDSRFDPSKEDVYGVLSKDSTKVTGPTTFYPLENATYSKGKDEKGNYISVYDIYDFDVPFQENIGLPYEVYDRVYYKKDKKGKLVPKYQKGGHIIQPDETFYGIANKYGIPNQDLILANPDLNIDKIRPGQRIRIPESFEQSEFPVGYFETSDKETFNRKSKVYPAPKKEEPVKKELPKEEPLKISRELNDELFLRQAFAESTFNPKAKSSAGYMGLAQIGNDVIKDYKKATGVKQVDPYDPAQNMQVQKWAMNQIYNSEFVNKEGQDPSVRLAKTLASYNWGKGNVLKHLKKQKAKGVDIYNSLDWVESLPKETRDYVHKIQLDDVPEFKKGFNKAIKDKQYKQYIDLYKKKNGGWLDSYQEGGQTKWLNNYK